MKSKAVALERETAAKQLYEEIGYSCFGPLIYGFTTWVKQCIDQESIDQLVYVARDGYVLKKAFEILFPEVTIPVKYLYVSRMSTMPSRIIDDPTVGNLLNNASLRKYSSLSLVLNRFGITKEEWAECGSPDNLDINASVEKDLFYSDVKYQEACKRILELYMPKAKEQSKLFLSYLKAEEISGRIILVDSGWNGSTQSALITADKDNNSLQCKGLYLMANYPSKQALPGMDIDGYLFDESHSHSDYVDAMTAQGLIEFFLSQKCGTTLGYKVDPLNGVTIPILGSYEFDASTGLSFVGEALDAMQEACLNYIRAKANGESVVEPLVYSDAFSALKRVTADPSKKELDYLGNLVFSEGEIHHLAKPKRTMYYATHPKELLRDFGASTWKLGFLCGILKNNKIANMAYHQLLKLK